MKNSGLSRVLVAENHPQVRDHLVDFLRQAGYEADPAESGQAALEMMASGQYDVVLLDSMMVDRDGRDLVSSLTAPIPELSVVVMSSVPSVDSVVCAIRSGACDYVAKPFNFAELSGALTRAVERRDRLEQLRSNPRYSGVVANGPGSAEWIDGE